LNPPPLSPHNNKLSPNNSGRKNDDEVEKIEGRERTDYDANI
jgi:hypothetical protein